MVQLGRLQLQNLDNVVDRLNLEKGSSSNFNSRVNGSDGNQVNHITRQQGAHVGFGDDLRQKDKASVLAKTGLGNVNGIEKTIKHGDIKGTTKLLGGLFDTGMDGYKVGIGKKLQLQNLDNVIDNLNLQTGSST